MTAFRIELQIALLPSWVETRRPVAADVGGGPISPLAIPAMEDDRGYVGV